MQEKLLSLIKKEGKIKSSSYTPQNILLEEPTTPLRFFRKHGLPSPYPKPMAKSKPYTEQRQNTSPRRVRICSQIPAPLHKEKPKTTTPIVKIRSKDYYLWFDGKVVEIFINKAENITEIEGESGRDIARKIKLWTKDEEISYHIEGMPGYETADWDQLKVSSITELFIKTQQEVEISNMTQ
ncbi:hypothetical protein O181_050374 [Austropuccinia psidii MF-1]|uniref:Uncharacterized protein n=1 Tax=Austropuccinia psidii MF-1 TaxID=1389203 RepID=A0A9Q3DWQ6_9BASI|nr:hypothetical protein [Austropuccinia psidii MF-1]